MESVVIGEVILPSIIVQTVDIGLRIKGCPYECVINVAVLFLIFSMWTLLLLRKLYNNFTVRPQCPEEGIK